MHVGGYGAKTSPKAVMHEEITISFEYLERHGTSRRSSKMPIDILVKPYIGQILTVRRKGARGSQRAVESGPFRQGHGRRL